MPRTEPVAIALAGLLVAGCVALGEPEKPAEPRRSALLQELAGVLPGRYTSPAAADGSGDDGLMMTVQPDPAAPPGQLRLLMTQSEDDGAPRRFALTLMPGENDERLRGRFAPLDGSGRPDQRHCEMTITVRDDGIAGRTDAENCRFDRGERSVGLIKEIAFDGTQLVIGERLVELPSGESASPDRVHSFLRIREFTGWAGVRENGHWRVKSDIAIDTTAAPIELADAAGMSLGLELRLAHYRMARGEQPVLLRLTVVDSESGERIAEAWADTDARAIGVALDHLQVGLDARRGR